MDQLLGISKRVIPNRVRDRIRDARRRFVFWRAMKRYLRDPKASTETGSRVLADLNYGWGNEGWSASSDYLTSCIDRALTSPGPILECGSGLSTILIGAVAHQRGINYWVLEDSQEWADKVQKCLIRYGFSSVKLCTKPLKNYVDYCWYDPPLKSMPAAFSLIVCDGPAGSTPGGRYGLVPVMRNQLSKDCVILLDDAGREEELSIVSRWKSELGATVNITDSDKPYAVITVHSTDHSGPRPS